MMTAQRAVRVYLAFYTLHMFAVSLVFAIATPFMQSIRLDTSDIALVYLTYWFVTMALDVPSGIFADRYGRLLATRIGIVIGAVGMAAHTYTNTLIELLLCEIVLAIGQSFVNGAMRAWLKSALNEHGAEPSVFSRAVMREAVYRNAATLIGGTTGGGIATYFQSLRAPWLASGLCFGLGGMVVYGLVREKEHLPKTASKTDTDEAPSFMGAALKMLRDSYALRWIAVAYFVYNAAFTALNTFWAPYFRARISNDSNTWMWAVMNVPLLVAAIWMNWGGVEQRRQTSVMSGGLFVACLSMLILPWMPTTPFMIGAMVLNELARGIFVPLQEVYVQRNITDERCRATYSSLQTTMLRAGFLCSQVAIWLLTRGEPVSVAVIDRLLVIFGVLGCAAAALLFLRHPTE